MEKLNETINGSFIGKFFELEERKTTFTTEIKAGTATFLTMAYILAVNPRIMAESGGSCEGDIFSPEYEACLEEIRRQFVTSTALCSFVACLAMGILSNLPIALAPGMGMNAYFTYNVVGWRGTGGVSYGAALTAIIIEGAIFFVLSVTGARFFISKLLPEPIKLATGPAIGAFLAHLGLQTAEGLGVVVSDIATSVTLGGCTPENRTPMVAYDAACENDGICVFSDSYTCDVEGGIMRSGTTWIGILGMMIMAIMMAYKRNSGIIVGIMFVTIISWFRFTPVSFFPDTAEGDARFAYFSKVVAIEPMDMLTAKYSGDLASAGLALVTFFFIDFLDTTCTLLAVVDPIGITDEKGDFPKSRQAFAVDAIATMFGSIFGLSPITSYIESAAGVEAGGRTGLTAVACSFYFLLAIFFAPILSSVPAWATGGALIIVGALMCRNLVKIQWDKIDHALTAFVVVMIMPLTYSIAYGLIGGLMVWVTMQLTFKIFELVGIAHPYKEESKEEDKEEEIKQEQPVKVDDAAKVDESQPAADETADA
jgi:AGZA family xanthine/uracil permease-like MFS transporter